MMICLESFTKMSDLFIIVYRRCFKCGVPLFKHIGSNLDYIQKTFWTRSFLIPDIQGDNFSQLCFLYLYTITVKCQTTTTMMITTMITENNKNKNIVTIVNKLVYREKRLCNCILYNNTFLLHHFRFRPLQTI